MMKRILLSCIALALVALSLQLISAPAVAGGQVGEEKLDVAALKSMLSGLGYAVKDIGTEKGKEKYEIAEKTTGFNVPIGVELSASKNYVWFTVFLGAAKSGDAAKLEQLLKENASIQPSFFYISSAGKLMLALPLDNRYVTAAVMKRVITKLKDDVGSTSSAWN